MANEETNALINDAVDGVLNDLIDWAALEIIFELHRSVKLGYYRELVDPDPSNIEKRGEPAATLYVHDVIMVCCVKYHLGLWRQCRVNALCVIVCVPCSYIYIYRTPFILSNNQANSLILKVSLVTATYHRTTTCMASLYK